MTLITEHLVSSDRYKMPLRLLLWSSKTLSKISGLIFPFSVFSSERVIRVNDASTLDKKLNVLCDGVLLIVELRIKTVL